MADPLFAISIRFRGIPIETWALLPAVIAALYVIFRWRKFGEDSFTWNHTYHTRAIAYGLGVWGLVVVTPLLPEPWHRFVLWGVVAIITILILDYWGSDGIFGSAILVLFMLLVGVTALPLPRVIGHFLYGEPDLATESTPDEPAILRELRAEGKLTTFALELPPNWKEVTGQKLRTYRSDRVDGGVLQISLFPPDEKPLDGPQLEQKLGGLLDDLGTEMAFGPRVSLAHSQAAAGLMATARHRSKDHGALAFWMIASEATIFASYTDGGEDAAESDIAEIGRALALVRLE